MSELEYQRIYNNRIERDVVCIICGISFSTYYKHKKTCSKECSLQLRKNNSKEKSYKRLKQWRKNNPEKLKLQIKKYVTNNSDKVFNWQKKYRDGNLDKVHLKEKNWRINNPEKKRIINNRNINLGINKISKNEKQKRLNLFDGCCYCNGQDNNLTIEHLVPYSKGGTNNPLNLFGACPICNSSKGNKFFLEWFRKQPFYNSNQEYNILQNTFAG